MIEGKKILITGSSGFVGSFLVEGGLQRGFQVWAGVRKSSNRKYLQDTNILFAELDFSNPEKLRNQLAQHQQQHGGWDYIVHCAGVTKCLNNEEFMKGNYEATRHFVEALQELHIEPQLFVFISSLSLFGPIHESDYSPICETDTPCPNTAYGNSKLMAENYLQSLTDFPYTILRPTGVYGPREKDYFLMAKSIQRHVDFSVGFKRQDITFVYVKDLVQAVYLAIAHRAVGRSYFVTDGGVYQSQTFSNLIQQELGNPFVLRIKCPLFLLKVITSMVGTLSHWMGKASTLNSDKYQILKQRNWRCDITPLQQELGYSPEYPLERGVREIIDWYKKEGWL